MKRILFFVWLIISCANPVSGYDFFNALIEHNETKVISSPKILKAADIAPEKAYKAYKEGKFQQLPKDARSFGFNDKPYWIAIELSNTAKRDFYISVENESLEEVTCFAYQDDKQISKTAGGTFNNLSAKEPLSMHPQFEMIKNDKPAVYLLKINSGSPLIMPIAIGTKSDLILQQLPEFIIFSIFAGCFIGLFLYNAILYFSTKESDYGLYAAYILCFFVLMAALREYFTPFIGQYAHAQNLLKAVALQATSLLLILFTLKFLNISNIDRKLFKSSIAFTIVAMVFFALNTAGAIGELLSTIFIFGLILLSMHLGMISVKSGYKPAKYYLAAVGGFFVGVIIYLLMANGIIEYNLASSSSPLVGSVWEMILLSLALGNKIKLLQGEKKDALLKAKTQEKILFLQSKYASVGETIGNIAHQWRQPLSEIGAIQANIKASMLYQGSIAKEKLLNSVELSSGIIRHLSDTIDTFYRFFKYKSDAIEEFDIGEEILNIQTIVKYSVDTDHVNLICNTSRGLRAIGNKNEFAHAILNIIINAKDALFAREVQHPTITVNTFSQNDKIIITISDNAGGIKEKPIEKIFESCISSKEDSIGIGLFITKTIIEKRMGGKITVANSENGAVFTVVLPIEGGVIADTFDAIEHIDETALERIARLEREVNRKDEIEKTLKQWDDIFKQAHWAIALHSGTSNSFEMVNPAFEKMYGYTQEDIKNISVPDLFTDESLAMLEKSQQKAFERGFVSFEAVHKHKNGSEFPVHIDLTVIKNENGEILYYIANIRDMTEQKQAEQRLLLKRFAISHIKDAIFLIDDEGNFQYVNVGACKSLGYTEEELLHMNVGDIDPDWPKERWPEHWEILKQVGSMTMELRHKRKDGTIFPVEVSANYIEFEGKAYNMAIARNITNRKAAEKELMLVSKALNNANEATYIMINERFVQVNDGACRMLGYTKEEFASMTLYDIDKDADPEIVEATTLAVASQNSLRFERQHTAKDGRVLDVEIVANFFEYDGTTYAFSTVRDITEQKKAKETLLLQDFALNNIREAVYLIDEKSMIHYINQGACNALGYTKDELLSLGIIDIDPNCTPEWWSEHWREITERNNFTIETTHRRKDGSVFPIEVSINNFDYKGVKYNLAVTRDITERKQLEAEKENRIIKTVAENSPDIIIRYDTDKRRTYANPNAKKLLDVVIGKTPIDATPIIDKDYYTQELQKVLETGVEATFEITYTNTIGGVDYSHIRMVPEFDDSNKICSVLMIGRDITELKLTIKALSEKEQELRALADSSPSMMGAYHMRPDGSVCMPYASPNVYDIFGVTAEEIRDDATPLMALSHPNDAEMIVRTIQESAQNMTLWHIEYRIIHPTKGVRWMEGNTMPYPHPDGGTIWYGYVHDITERKQVEETVKLLQHSLDFSLESLFITDADTKELKFVQVNDVACKTLGYSKDELLGGMSITDINPDYDANAVQTHLDSLKHTQNIIFETRHRSKSGRIYPVEVRSSYFEYENKKYVLSLTIDITERKHLEAQLQKERKFLLDAQRVAHTGSWYLDLQNDTLSWSDETYRIFELKKEEVTDLHATFYEYVHPEDREMVRAPYEQTLKTGDSYEVEHRVLMPDGRIKYVIERCEHAYAEDGTPLYSVGTVQDITERKAQEEKLNKLYELSTLGIALTDIDGKYIEFNDAFCKICGYSLDELQKLDYWTLTPIEYEKQELEQLESLKQTGHYGPYEKVYRQKNGNLIPIRLNGVLIKGDNGEEYIWSIVEDISERKRMEMELENSHDFLHQLIDSVPDPVFVKNRKHTWLMLNKAFCELFGLPKEALIGKSDYDVFPKEEADVFWEKDEEVFNSGDININEEYFTSSDGTTHYIQTVKAGFAANDGQKYLVGTIRDLSERKRMEDELRKALEFNEGVIGAIPDLLFEVTPDGIYTGVWAQNEELLVIQRELLLGRDFKDVMPPEAVIRCIQTLKEVDEKGFSVGNSYSLDLPDGKRWFELSATKKKTSGAYIILSRDITERKIIENELRNSEQKFRTLVENSSDSIARYDKNCRVLYMNPGLLSVLGTTLEEEIGKTPTEGPCLGIYDEYESELKNVIATGESSYVYLTLQDIGQGELYHYAHIVPERDVNGDTIGAVVFGRDITELLKSEKAVKELNATLEEKVKERTAELSQKEAQYRAIVENSHDVIARYDLTGRRIYVNPMMQILLGKPLEDILGKTPSEYSPLADNVDFNRLFKLVVAEGKEVSIEAPYTTSDGDARWGHVRIAPELDSDENVTSVLVVGRDMTEIKVVETQLKILEKALDSISEAIYIIGDDGKVAYASDMACAILGYGRNELYDMSIHDIDSLTAADRMPNIEVSRTHFEYKNKVFNICTLKNTTQKGNS